MNSEISGFVRIETERVISCCQKTIARIKSHRCQLRRKNVKKILEEQERSWSRFWRWLGFSRPNRRSAIRVYIESREYIWDRFPFRMSEIECCKLITAANVARKYMWVSAEAIELCRIK